MEWTKKRPAKQGWYWCKVRYEQPHIVFVMAMLDGGFNVCYGDQAIAIEWYKKYREKFWAGPIPEPEEE
jgi:hypothetical protein